MDGPVPNLDPFVRALAALRGRDLQLRRAVESSFVPMGFVDNERRFISENRALRLLFRMNARELTGAALGDFTAPERRWVWDKRWVHMLRHNYYVGPHELVFPDRSRLEVVVIAMANALPGRHLIATIPRAWPVEALGDPGATTAAPQRGRLSPREADVLALLASGRTVDEVAAELTVEPSTVKTHLRNAHRKLGARNRAHAVAIAVQQSVIEPGRIAADGDPSQPAAT
jgi:DNA-binding CsgD family transcriptional regulator